jgi:hypothetical protein
MTADCRRVSLWQPLASLASTLKRHRIAGPCEDPPVTLDAASKPILFLLDREFEDRQIPGQRFFCRHSLLLEGALSSIEGLDAQLDVRRIGFARPRREVIAEIGEQDQSLPKLVLPRGVRSELASGAHQDRQYISGAEPILAALNGLLGIPVAHP